MYEGFKELACLTLTPIAVFFFWLWRRAARGKVWAQYEPSDDGQNTIPLNWPDYHHRD